MGYQDQAREDKEANGGERRGDEIMTMKCMMNMTTSSIAYGGDRTKGSTIQETGEVMAPREMEPLPVVVTSASTEPLYAGMRRTAGRGHGGEPHPIWHIIGMGISIDVPYFAKKMVNGAGDKGSETLEKGKKMVRERNPQATTGTCFSAASRASGAATCGMKMVKGDGLGYMSKAEEGSTPRGSASMMVDTIVLMTMLTTAGENHWSCVIHIEGPLKIEELRRHLRTGSSSCAFWLRRDDRPVKGTCPGAASVNVEKRQAEATPGSSGAELPIQAKNWILEARSPGLAGQPTADSRPRKPKYYSKDHCRGNAGAFHVINGEAQAKIVL